jgi:hypothetical protein
MMKHQTAQVTKICDAWQRATVPRNIVGAFRAAGLVSYPGRDHRWHLRFEELEATQIHDDFPQGIHLDDVVEDAVLSATATTRGDICVWVRLT